MQKSHKFPVDNPHSPGYYPYMTSLAFKFGAQLVIPPTIAGHFRTMQVEETKRQAIIANREVLIARITAEKDTLLAYFDHKFAERRAALDEFFELLHHAIASGDNQQLVAALSGILTIIQDNPLDDFETFKANFQDPDYVVEI